MAGIPGVLLSSLREVLRKCDDVFFDQRDLRDVFIDERLQIWRDRLQDASGLGERVDHTISYLYDKNRSSGENALVLFLTVLSERYFDDRRERLKILSEQLNWLHQLSVAQKESFQAQANPLSAPMLAIADAEKMLERARAVARITVPRIRQGNLEKNESGTAWLIAPGLAITCWHVIEASADMGPPIEPTDLQAQLDNMQLVFDFTQVGKGIQYSVACLEYPTIDSQILDYALLRLNDREDYPLSRYDYLRLDTYLPLTQLTSLYIIQHPLGQYQQVNWGTFECLSAARECILYRTPTEPGTSGAPVFNRDNWCVVALHNGESREAKLREGTLLKFILEDLEKHKPELYHEIMRAQSVKGTKETDSRHVDLEGLLEELEREISPETSAPSSQGNKPPHYAAQSPRREQVSSEKQHLLLLACKLHEEILKELQAVANVRALFNPRKKVIYSDECRRLIDPLSKLSKRIQELDSLIIEHPFDFGRTRTSLIKVLNAIDRLLNELKSILMDYCPRSLEAPMIQRQDIQRKLAETAKYLRRMNSLMNEIKKLLNTTT